MITVTILINGEPIYTRTAINKGKVKADWIQGNNTTQCNYKVDDGTIIKHDTEDGAIVLAKKMLDTIKEAGE